MIKLLREACGLECIAESMIHKWHSTFSKNVCEVLLCEKKGGQPRTSIIETNINTLQEVIDDDRNLSTGTLEALLHILRAIIHCILTEKLAMVRMASTWVPHMLHRTYYNSIVTAILKLSEIYISNYFRFNRYQ